MSPARALPAFDEAGFRRLAARGFFAPARGPRDLIRRYRALGERGTALGFGVSCVAHQIAVELVRQYGTPAQQARALAPLREGRWLGAIANTEGPGGTDIRAMAARVEDGRLHARKNCFTNGPGDLVFVSAWTGADEHAKLEVLMLEGERLVQEDLRFELPGFRTGRTGRLVADGVPVDLDADRLGGAGRGFEILKFCFDLERLMIAALIHGVIRRAEKELGRQLRGRRSFGRALGDHQWVQDKAIELRRANYLLRGLLEICGLDYRDGRGWPAGLRALNTTLSLLKWQAVEQGIAALTAAFEAGGVRSLQEDAPHLALITDLYHLKFLGGTRELQKSFLWQDLLQGFEETDHEQVRTAQKIG